ncbi:MAG: peptidoglycan-associated lipoprotein Pal [Pseudomonadota bacterium]
MASRLWLTNTLLLAAATFLLAGCGGGNTIPDPEPTDTVGDGGGASSSGDDFDRFGEGEEVPFGDMDSELSNVIYFDFDSYEVNAGDADIVNRHSIQLLDGGASVRLEGHADERGSREYNIGLGERRAQAVRRMLMIQGVPASRISTVSFGEERPAETGSDETAYAANRRVVITYTN